MVVGCGIGCDHGQMWWNDAIMQDMERHVKFGATLCLENVVRCEMWWCNA